MKKIVRFLSLGLGFLFGLNCLLVYLVLQNVEREAGTVRVKELQAESLILINPNQEILARIGTDTMTRSGVRKKVNGIFLYGPEQKQIAALVGAGIVGPELWLSDGENQECTLGLNVDGYSYLELENGDSKMSLGLLRSDAASENDHMGRLGLRLGSYFVEFSTTESVGLEVLVEDDVKKIWSHSQSFRDLE